MNALHRPLACAVHYVIFIYNQKRVGGGGGGGKGVQLKWSTWNQFHVMMTFVLQDGCSPLYIAGCNGYLDVVKTLLEAGANINQANNVGICRHIFSACWMSHIPIYT